MATRLQLCTNVEIAGDWSNNWDSTPCVQNPEGLYEASLDLSPGTYQYKYRVNDTWILDSTKDTVRTSDGIQNNVLTVEDDKEESTEDWVDLRLCPE